MKLAIGIDAGGTKLAAGLVDVVRGSVIRRQERPTEAARGGEAVLSDCRDLADLVRGTAEVIAVGLGVPELVSPAGEITGAVNWDWRGVDLAAAFAGIGPLVVESDVRAAALGESAWGAGAGLGSFMYVTVGTGISHCLVIAGRPWAGARGNALVLGAPPVEQLASGSALSAAAGTARAQDVLGDARHAPLVATAAHALGGALAALVNATDPEALVVGGGLGLEPGFMSQAIEHMRERIYDPATRRLAVLDAALGRNAGVAGAALAAAATIRPAGS